MSVNNKRIFQDYLVQQFLGWKPMFLGDHPRCDAGGCGKIVLTERQALVMPAGLIHMVGTNSESVALGVTFIHRGHLLTAARVFRHKQKHDETFNSCYPAYPLLTLNELMVHLWLVSKIELIYFCRKKK